MLAGNIYAPRKVELVETPEPELGPRPADGEAGEILFQPTTACLCGSDMPYFERDYPECQPKMGHSLHEMIGTVVATNGLKFQAGDRVLCVPAHQRGLRERFAVSEQRAIPLDPRVSNDHAVIAQPLGTILYALRKLPNLLDLNVVVVGQGAIGQLFCAVVRNLGARQIIAVDRLANRLQISSVMGATSTIDNATADPVDAVAQLTGGAMADLVIEAVGHREQALDLCAQLCRKYGTILYFGVPPETIDGVRWLDLFRKNINVQTTVNPDFARDFPLAMRWVAEKRIDVSPVITHRFPLAQIQQAFEMYHQRQDGSLKVFVDFPAAGK